jgi:hypothetical protein
MHMTLNLPGSHVLRMAPEIFDTPPALVAKSPLRDDSVCWGANTHHVCAPCELLEAHGALWILAALGPEQQLVSLVSRFAESADQG